MAIYRFFRENDALKNTKFKNLQIFLFISKLINLLKKFIYITFLINKSLLLLFENLPKIWVYILSGLIRNKFYYYSYYLNCNFIIKKK